MSLPCLRDMRSYSWSEVSKAKINEDFFGQVVGNQIP